MKLKRLSQHIAYHQGLADSANDPALAELHAEVVQQLRPLHDDAAEHAARMAAIKDARGI
jgi:hypothetical protein